MAKRLIEYDALTRTEVWHDYDHNTGETTIAEIQDVKPVLGSTLAARNHGSAGKMGVNEYSKHGIKNNMWHVASIPNSVVLKWKREHGVDVFNKHQWKEVRKLLNDSEWAYLRTGTGRV